MSELLLGGLLIQIFAPFLVTCICTLIGFFVGRAYGRRQGYSAGWYERGLAGKQDPPADYWQKGSDHDE